jgi:hypothetical protein
LHNGQQQGQQTAAATFVAAAAAVAKSAISTAVIPRIFVFIVCPFSSLSGQR